MNTPNFDNEPTIEIIFRWKEKSKHRQAKVTEICVYNEEELQDLREYIEP